MLKGIDVSHHQSTGISLDGWDFVICKATEGNGYTDETCNTHYQRAKAQGKKLGVYHYARPDLGNTPEAEAEWFLSQIKGYIGEAILALDWEDKSLNYPVSWAKAWLDYVYRETGVRPLLYISRCPVNEMNWSSVANADYGLWVADYTGNKPNVKWWSFYALWQYTSGGNLDKNIFYGDRTAWDKYANPKGTPEPTPEPTPSKKSVEELANEVLEGKWGNGEERKQRLEAAGYNYQEVQNRVNEKLGTNKPETFNVGDKVLPIKLVDYKGKRLRKYDDYYTITELNGDRAVLSARGQVWAAVNTNNLKKV